MFTVYGPFRQNFEISTIKFKVILKLFNSRMSYRANLTCILYFYFINSIRSLKRKLLRYYEMHDAAVKSGKSTVK